VIFLLFQINKYNKNVKVLLFPENLIVIYYLIFFIQLEKDGRYIF
jgi:hypothetical protein